MKKTRKLNGTLETLLVIGLILIIPLFFVIRTAAVQNAAPNTPVPSLPTAANVSVVTKYGVNTQPGQASLGKDRRIGSSQPAGRLVSRLVLILRHGA